eukprot:9308211-Pyramimonas_sp.AAC.1
MNEPCLGRVSIGALLVEGLNMRPFCGEFHLEPPAQCLRHAITMSTHCQALCQRNANAMSNHGQTNANAMPCR